jgi:hypothetical protein
VAESLIKRRCVISIGDYEPIDVTQQFASFQRGLARFAKTWNVKVRVSPFKMEADGAVAVWHTETTAPNWQVKTEFRILNWSDLVRRDFQHWNLNRVWRAAKAISNFVFSGTGWRYFRLNWRFGLFFFYPALVFLFSAMIALWLVTLLGSFEVPFASLFGFGVVAALLVAFIKWVDPFVLPRVVDMWIFMHELVHLERTGLAERLGVFSQDIIEKLQSDHFDEIVIVGHGIGAVIQPIIVDRAFWALPEFGKQGRSVSLLSLGSMLLAVGLHPEGGWAVGPLSRVVRDRWVFWAEYQAYDDIIGFPGINPVAELIDDQGKPKLQKIQVKDMVDIKSSFPESIFKNHRALLQANTKKYFYDYFMICCGPFSLPTRVEYPDLMVTAFHSDGRLISDG